MLFRSEILNVFTHNPILGHITTFGGHPVSCTASLATLEVILEEQLTSKVEAKAVLFKTLLQHQHIKAIRNLGLLMAVEFKDFAILHQIIQKLLALGVMTDWFLYNDCSMRIAPPLTITEAEITEVCHIIVKCLDTL